jgi:cytochrome c oxidase assembly protein subunit 15
MSPDASALALIDWTPWLRVVGLGLALACGPLAWVWLRHRQADVPQRLRALTLLTLFLTFDLVLFGAFTRLTDSGLGCPDWPGCYGSASPLGAQADIHAAQSAMPTGPVTHGKAWVEMVHRYLATGVGVLITVLALGNGWAARRDRAAVSPWWAALTLFWVCVQGAFGALTVTMKLYPAIVTGHLLGGLGLLVLLALQAEQTRRATAPLPGRLRTGLWAVAGLTFVQVSLGAWVSTNYAVLACSDFPTCQGQWLPPMDVAQGFTLLRGLGEGADGGYLPFAALTAIHWMHRLGALVLLLALSAVVRALWREGSAGARRAATGLAAAGVWQLLTGLSNVVLGWPLLAAVAHTGGAAALVTWLTVCLVRSQARPHLTLQKPQTSHASPVSPASSARA